MTWRDRPTMKVRECAELLGVCVRVFEANVLPELQTREVGRQRLVLVPSLLKWLGEDPAVAEEQKAVRVKAMREARRIMGRVG